METVKTHNGWTNYETWRISLEIFEGFEPEGFNDVYQLSKYLEQYAEEIIFSDCDQSSLAGSYVLAFLSEVNYYEIAENILADYSENNQ